MQHLKRFGIFFAAILLLVAGLSCFAGCDPAPSGTIYSLREAYEDGLLTEGDLMSIAYYSNNGVPYPEELDDRIDQSIRETVAYKYRSDREHPNPDATVDALSISQYYGEYHGYYAVLLDYDRAVFGQVPEVVVDIWFEIGGVLFHQRSHDFIEIWGND